MRKINVFDLNLHQLAQLLLAEIHKNPALGEVSTFTTLTSNGHSPVENLVINDEPDNMWIAFEADD